MACGLNKKNLKSGKVQMEGYSVSSSWPVFHPAHGNEMMETRKKS